MRKVFEVSKPDMKSLMNIMQQFANNNNIVEDFIKIKKLANCIDFISLLNILNFLIILD